MIAAIRRALIIRRARQRLEEHVQANRAKMAAPHSTASRKGWETRRAIRAACEQRQQEAGA